MAEQKIHFVTGKGGVGKTAVATALAESFAREGLKTLLVDLGSDEGGGSFEPQLLKPNLYKASWGGEECLRDYLKYLIKSESLIRLFWETPVTKSLVNAAPGLSELSILGKITSGIRHHGPPLSFDILVIDAYSTGHFKSLLMAPEGLRSTIQSGPIFEQGRTIKETLLNPKVTSFHIISLSDEYAIQESLDLQDFLSHYGSQKIQIWLNKFLSIDSTLDLSSNGNLASQAPEFANYLQNISAKQLHANQELKNKKNLPWVFESEFIKIVEGLSTSLAGVVK